MKSLLILFFVVFFGFNSTFAQKRQIDSLETLIKSTKQDTNKVSHFNTLAIYYIEQKKFKNAEKHLLSSLALAERLGSLKKLEDTHKNLSELYRITNKPAKEIEHYKEYISFRDSLSNEAESVRIFNEFERAKKESNDNRLKINTLIALSIVWLFTLVLFITKYFQAKRIENEIKPLQSINEDITRKRTEWLETIEQQKTALEKYLPIIDIEKEALKMKNELSEVISDYQENLNRREKLQKEVDLLEEKIENIDYGFYKPHFPFKSGDEFKIELEKIVRMQQEMVKGNRAAICEIEWTIGQSVAEGKKMIKQMSKLMLKAFNGEADASIARVSWSNVVTMEVRIVRAQDTINKLGETMQIHISNAYRELKLKELYLNFELEEKLYREKEEQRRIREQMRDEERARREIERAMREAEEEEDRYQKAVDKAKLELSEAKGKQLDELTEKIKILEERLLKAHEVKERAISRAQLTKSGYVYIISNIGSFGEDVYKIGMTRRLDPQDRVDELGDASVPFDFDVHGFIYSENAPDLESTLHERFDKRRVNLVNYRTEFFKVTIDEIEVAVEELDLKVELTKIVPAKEYRETLSLIAANSLIRSKA